MKELIESIENQIKFNSNVVISKDDANKLLQALTSVKSENNSEAMKEGEQRFLLEEEKSTIYHRESNRDICNCYDEELQVELLRVLNNSDFNLPNQ